MTSPLPPNQRLAAPGRWPVVGEKSPSELPAVWDVAFGGSLIAPGRLTIDDLRAMPQETWDVDVHCVTRWSKPGMSFRGVPLAPLLARFGPMPEARFLSFVARSAQDHSTSLPISAAEDVLLALEAEGRPLTTEHGGPLRTVTRNRYFYKSLKWLCRIEVLPEDRLGTWERESGYHNEADPWREQRYMAPALDRATVRRVLESRRGEDLDLRSLQAAGFDLEGFMARGARLRDADFTGAVLRGADFSQANLSNARLRGADLRGARLLNADVEGADLTGADLRGADFTGASLFGATFANADGSEPARVDASTRFSETAFDALTPADLRVLAGATR